MMGNYQDILVFLRGVNPRSAKVKSIFKQIDTLPKKLVSLFISSDLNIIVFKGEITNNPELELYKGVVPRNYPKDKTWDKVGAMYQPLLEKVFIGIEGDYYNKRDVFLHELGHAFDDMVGHHLVKKSLSEIKGISKMIKKQPFEKEYFNLHPREYIANSFDLYFQSKKSNKYLKKKHKKVWKLINKSVKKVKKSID